MTHRRLFQAILKVLSVAAALGLSPTARADLLFQIQVDTTAITNQSGFFDLEFNPASVGATTATATISNFGTDGTLLSDPASTTDGDVTGSLASTLTINNTDQLNDLLQAIRFGTSMSFDLDISGPATTTPDPNGLGSAFGLSLYDSNFNPLLTTDPLGTVAMILLNADTTTTIETFPTSPGSGSAATVTFAGNTVPEPSTIVNGGMALVALGCFAICQSISATRKRNRPGQKNE